MKTTVKQLTATTFIALFLIAIGVKAEGVTTKLSVNEATETTLRLENWMTDQTIWSTSNMEFFVLESDDNLEVEDWMTNAETWNANFNFYDEAESSLEVENWMTDVETWNVKKNIDEPGLAIKDWMIDSEIWK